MRSRPRCPRSHSHGTHHSPIGSNSDNVAASSTHDLATVDEAVDDDGLVPDGPVPLIDQVLPIPPVPILVGDDDAQVEQVPVLVLAQLAQAITTLACSVIHPTPILVPAPVPIHPPALSTSL